MTLECYSGLLALIFRTASSTWTASLFFVKVLCLRGPSSMAAFPSGILGEPKQAWPPKGAFQVGQMGGSAPTAGEEGECQEDVAKPVCVSQVACMDQLAASWFFFWCQEERHLWGAREGVLVWAPTHVLCIGRFGPGTRERKSCFMKIQTKRKSTGGFSSFITSPKLESGGEERLKHRPLPIWLFWGEA